MLNVAMPVKASTINIKTNSIVVCDDDTASRSRIV